MVENSVSLMKRGLNQSIALLIMVDGHNYIFFISKYTNRLFRCSKF